MAFELVCYLNFGYPTIEKGIEYVKKYYACGCRAIQLDLPSANPYLEQPRIQKRMAYCLETNPDLQTYLDGIHQVHTLFPDMKIYLMMYGDTVERVGMEKLLEFCRENRIRNASFVGHSEQMQKRLDEAGMVTACYVQCQLPEAEVEAARKVEQVAYQVRPLAGQDTREDIQTYADGVRYLRAHGVGGKIYASVGIKTPDDIRMVRTAGADGAFIGGVLMNVIEDEEALKHVLTTYIEAAYE